MIVSPHRVRIGKNVSISPYVVIGEKPQHLKFLKQEASPDSSLKIIIGDNVIIREFTNIHLPTDHRHTVIGNDCLLMSHCHIAHDSQLSSKVILTTGTHLGGHTTILEGAGLGLNCSTHQFTTIGAYSLVGMGSVVVKDIPPFLIFIAGVCYKINVVGMERAGFSEEEILQISRYYLTEEPVQSKRLKQHIDAFNAIRNPQRKVAELFFDDFSIGTLHIIDQEVTQ